MSRVIFFSSICRLQLFLEPRKISDLIIQEINGSPCLSPAAQEEPAGASTLESLLWDIGYEVRFGSQPVEGVRLSGYRWQKAHRKG